MSSESVSRRDFNRLTAAAFSGMLAASTLGCDPAGAPVSPPPAGGPTPPVTPAAPATTGAAIPVGTENLAMGEKHLCRGLNTCKGLGADTKNECAGQGTCATVEQHACGGMNECKGFGGCGANAGVNECKEKGGCHVPLMDDAWKQVRELLEKRMQADGKTLGAAPAATKEG